MLHWHAQLKGESSAGEMKFSSVPIFKSSLRVILFFGCFPQSHFLFVLHERAHSLSPSQVYHFPLLLLNASYPNGMFSEFLPFTGLDRRPRTDIQTPHSRLPPCAMQLHLQNERRFKILLWPQDPRLFSSRTNPVGPSVSPSVPIKTAAAEAEPGGAKMQAWEEPGPFHVTFPSGLGGPSVEQWMFLIPSNTWLGGHGRDFKPQVNMACQSQIHRQLCMNS